MTPARTPGTERPAAFPRPKYDFPRHDFPRHDFPGHNSPQRGFTLVEVLVTVALSLILLGSILQLFSVNQQSFRVQTAMNELNDNGRFAIQQIGHHLRMANYWGGARRVEQRGPVNIIENCTFGSGIEDTAPLASLGHDRSSGQSSGCLSLTGDILPASGSGYVGVRYAGPEALTDAELQAGGVYVRARVGEALGYIFQGSDVSSFVDTRLEDAMELNVGNFPLRQVLYYVAQCADADADNSCDDGTNIDVGRTLRRREMIFSGMSETIVANNARQLTLQYIVDLSLDGSDIRFASPGAQINALAGARPDFWINNVIGARASVQLASPVRIPGRDTPLSRTFTTTVHLRNHRA